MTSFCVHAEHLHLVARWLSRFGIVGEARQDATQDVFRIAVERADRFVGGSLEAWLYRISQNVARNAHRKRISIRRRELLDDDGTDGWHGAAGAEQCTSLEWTRFVGALSGRDRAILELGCVRGLGAEEVGRKVRLSRAQVYRRMRTMELGLRERLAVNA